MATEAQILANRSNAQESTGPEPVSSSPPSPKLPILPSFAQNYDLFMQNKANLLDALMNISSILTKYYENKSNWTLGENKPKQTQFQRQKNLASLRGGPGLAIWN